MSANLKKKAGTDFGQRSHGKRRLAECTHGAKCAAGRSAAERLPCVSCRFLFSTIVSLSERSNMQVLFLTAVGNSQ